jgi:hypothetical protein
MIMYILLRYWPKIEVFSMWDIINSVDRQFINVLQIALSQICPVHIFTSHFYIIYFDNILPTKSKISSVLFPIKILKQFIFSSLAYYIPEFFSLSLILATTTNHEAPYYAAFFSFQLLPPS